MFAFDGPLQKHGYEQLKHGDQQYSCYSTPTNGLHVSQEGVWTREAGGTKSFNTQNQYFQIFDL